MSNKFWIVPVLTLCIYILCIPILLSAQTEVTITTSYSFPSTITLKLEITGTGTRLLNFEEYIQGVVYTEMFSDWKPDALKAQAVAARSFAKVFNDRHGYVTDNPDNCQSWLPPPSPGYPTTIKDAVNLTQREGVIYNNSILETTYFSSTKNLPHYTRNSEDWTGYYHFHLRKTITPEENVGIGGHRVGMSQYGAKELTKNGVNYKDILKHYYGPVPLYIKRVKVIQAGEIMYHGYWTDNHDYPNPTRKFDIPINKPLSEEIDAIIQIYFTEEISGISQTNVRIANQEASYEGWDPSPNEPFGIAKFKVIKQVLKNIGAGEHSIRIEAKHKYAQEWQLDSNPQTFCYQNHNANNLVNYEPGADTNHKVLISSPENHPPELSNGYVEPSEGSTSTDFYYYVTFFDPDGDSPEKKLLITDEGTAQATVYVMQFFSDSSANGIYRSDPIKLSEGSHKYHFEFTDVEGGSARLPSNTDQYFLGPNVTEPPIISGYVCTSDGTGIEGVTMSGPPGPPSTTSSGYYSATVSYGWKGTITPTKSGYSFDPPTRSYSNVTSNQSDQNYTRIPPTRVEENLIDKKPMVFALDQNYPNPFNSETHIRYELPKTGKVYLAVYDVRGNAICTLVEHERSAGVYEVIWVGKNNAQETVSSGIYILRMYVRGHVFFRKILFVK